MQVDSFVSELTGAVYGTVGFAWVNSPLKPLSVTHHSLWYLLDSKSMDLSLLN